MHETDDIDAIEAEAKWNVHFARKARAHSEDPEFMRGYLACVEDHADHLTDVPLGVPVVVPMLPTV